MLNTNPRIRDALAMVHSAYEHCLEKDNESTIPRAFLSSRLTAATDKYLMLDEPELHKALVDYWFWHFESHLRKSYVSSILAGEIDSCIKLLSTSTLASTHEKGTPAAHTLACICLLRLSLTTPHAAHPQDANVFKLVDMWFGSNPETPKANPIEAMVDRLYGTACWSLCRDEVDEDAQMPLFLWKMNYPLVQLKNPGLAQAHIPSDII